ncbi:MAG: DNA translocase FtsK, partial [Oscillospiraceae bacterium]
TYVRDGEISATIEFIKRDFTAEYNQEMIDNMEKLATKEKNSGAQGNSEEKDEMLTKAIETVVEAGQASTSLLQRRLKLGYARAARIMDEMEAMGIIGGYEGSKPRQILITKNQWLEMTLSQND